MLIRLSVMARGVALLSDQVPMLIGDSGTSEVGTLSSNKVECLAACVMEKCRPLCYLFFTWELVRLEGIDCACRFARRSSSSQPSSMMVLLPSVAVTEEF
jgi:hypothetical protein